MEAILKRGDDAEVPATSSHPPEEVGVFGRVGRKPLPIGRDQIDRQEVIAREATLAHEETKAAAEGESCNACGRDETTGGCQAESLGLVVELTPGQARFRTSGASGQVDLYPFHPGQVDHEATIADGVAGDTVAAPSDRDEEVVGAGEIDGGDDICDSSTANDEGGVPVDHALPDPSGGFIAIVARAQKRTA